jgi:tetratricopeptide (TPR) repeat protein
MSGSRYEGYKDALRRGHVAALRGRLDLALTAYREASRIAPDRALPYVGQGGVLAKLGRVDEALAAYRTAMERTPDDEGALRGRADLLAAEGRRAEAATTLDRLAGALERGGRIADACDVARRALELAESRGRRKLVQVLVERLRESASDPSVAESLARALGILEADATGPSRSVAPIEAEAEGEAEDAPSVDEPPAPKVRLVPPQDPLVLARAFDAAFDTGNLEEARKQAVATAAAHRAVGQIHAAIDACYQALALAPADPSVHFALAQLYLDRGWRSLAADKLVLIGRLSELNRDSASMARLCDLAVRRFPDDARLAAMCR